VTGMKFVWRLTSNQGSRRWKVGKEGGGNSIASKCATWEIINETILERVNEKRGYNIALGESMSSDVEKASFLGRGEA